MNLDFVGEVWDALKSHIDSNDRKDAADTLVNLLIDNGYDASEIKDTFTGDKNIMSALAYYIEQHETEEDYEEYDEDEDEEEW